MKVRFLLFVTLLVAAGLPNSAAAADYHTVCGVARFFDMRFPRSAGSGSKLTPSTNNTNRPHKNLQVELWDEDGYCNDWLVGCEETDDDLLGTATTDSAGVYCFSNIGQAEDIYVKSSYKTDWTEVQLPNGSGGGVSPIVASYPTLVDFGVTHSPTLFNYNFSTTCWNNTYNTVVGYCDDADVAYWDFWEYVQYSNLSATMSDIDTAVSDAAFGVNQLSARIAGFWPDGPAETECSGSNAGRAWSKTAFCVDEGAQTHTVGHEFGHVMQMRALNRDGLSSGCANPHGWAVPQNQACVVSEGFGNFFAAATHFTSTSTSAFYAGGLYNLEGDSATQGTACETAASGDPDEFEANAARFFWDLYDSTNIDESSSGSCDNVNVCSYCDAFDNTSWTLSTIVLGWDLPEGTANHQNNEPGNNARNVWDYWHRNRSSCQEVWLNCLDAHDD